MEHDIHPERPKPVVEKLPRKQPAWMEPALCVVAPVLGANMILSVLLGLPIVETIWFGIFAASLTVWSLRFSGAPAAPGVQQSDDRLPILVALILAVVSFGLAWKVAIVFASVGIAALVFAVCSLVRGVGAARASLWPFAILLFSFPWIDPTESLIGYPWRSFLVSGAAAAAKPLVGAVSVQGTTIGAESMRLALAWDVGGFWQAQFFLLCALGLAVGSDWKPIRYVFWLGIALLSALMTYLGFITSLFIASVLASGGSVTPAWGKALELCWWTAAFGVLWWIAGRLRTTHRHEAAKKAAERAEAMFP